MSDNKVDEQSNSNKDNKRKLEVENDSNKKRKIEFTSSEIIENLKIGDRTAYVFK